MRALTWHDRWLRVVLSGGLVVGLAGCEGAQVGSVPTPLVDAEVVELWSAGGVEEKGGLVLGGPLRHAALGPNGLRVLPDREASRILFLDERGALLREVGRAGDGPGEFRGLVGVGFLADGTIWVLDRTSRRFTYLAPDGGTIRTEQQPREEVEGTPWVVQGEHVLANGGLLGQGLRTDRRTAAGDLPRVPLAVWDEANELVVLEWLEPVSPRTAEIPMAEGNFDMTSDQLLEGFPIIGTAPGGEWIFVLDRAPSEEPIGTFRIRRFSLDGNRIDDIEIPYHAKLVDGSVVDRIDSYTRILAERAPIEAEDAMATWWIPDRLPPVRAALADSSGFWLQREMTTPGVWERYDLDGEFVTRIELPAGFQVLAATRTRLLGWEFDEMEVPVIREFTVTY